MIQCAALATACLLAAAHSQPTGCLNDTQCATHDYYCDETFNCRECLRCDTLSREPPKTTSVCVKYYSECGPCLPGLVEDQHNGCKQPEPAGSLPSYVWAVIGVCLLLFLLVLVALVFMLRHTDTFKVLASTRTSVQAPVGSNGGPSAPQPPPYNPGLYQYEAVRPSSPPGSYEDTSRPLVKRDDSDASPAVGNGVGGAAREASSNQRAKVYNNPAYVRNVPPPSYSSAVSEDSEPESPFVDHDEDTMESVWTPAADHNTTALTTPNPPSATATLSSEDTMSEAVRRSMQSCADANNVAPPAKIRRVQDTNNNRSGGESSGAGASASVVINVLNVNSVHQLTDLTL